MKSTLTKFYLARLGYPFNDRKARDLLKDEKEGR